MVAYVDPKHGSPSPKLHDQPGGHTLHDDAPPKLMPEVQVKRPPALQYEPAGQNKHRRSDAE